MTLKELYEEIGGNYEQAIRVLIMEKLMDKHIRKLPHNSIFTSLAEAASSFDTVSIFENAHAIKGVCLNLGLTELAAVAEEICNEFRSGNERKLTDDEVRQKISIINTMFKKACDGIHDYEQSNC